MCLCLYNRQSSHFKLHALVTTKYGGDMHEELAKSQVSYMHWSQLNIVVFLITIRLFFCRFKQKLKFLIFLFVSN